MLREIEKLRKQNSRKIYGLLLLWALMTAALVIYEFGYVGITRYRSTAVFVSACVLFVVFFYSNKLVSGYVNQFYELFLNHLFDKRIHLTFKEYGRKHDFNDFQNVGLIEDAEFMEYQDLMEGICHNKEFKVMFVSAYNNQKIYVRGHAPQKIQIFSGSYLMVKLNESQKGKVFVSYQPKEILVSNEKTFESMFKVRCEGCDVSEVMTDELKDKIMKIHSKHLNASFCVVDGWLHVAVSGYKLMPVPDLYSKVNPVLIERMGKRMKEINELIVLSCE
jgi:hypothetical protein